MDQFNNNEFLSETNENKETESVPVTMKVHESKTAFMSFIAVSYGALMLLNTFFWYFGIALTNDHDPDHLMLFYGISIDIFILQAIFATNPLVVRFKKTRLFLPIIYCIVLILW